MMSDRNQQDSNAQCSWTDEDETLFKQLCEEVKSLSDEETMAILKKYPQHIAKEYEENILWTDEDESQMRQMMAEINQSDLSDEAVRAIESRYSKKVVEEYQDMCDAVVSGAIAAGKAAKEKQEQKAEGSDQ
ncbi:hypothetical protein ACQ4M4_12850 [Leptolyngbya sp. AN02str]|uniref:hypothetical protein n=1 Tax=Leptolyngbya sp. AN02str TaxID=3423363 RepID=UPI003D3146F4